MRARSTAASVWPARTSTPPSRARSGKMWPGRARSDGLVFGLIAARTVAARSAAEMPVLVPRLASIATQNAVSKRVEFLLDHQRNLELVEPLAGHRHADQAAAVLRHEVDRLGRHLLGGHRQVAFVLAILVVDDDDHLAAADRGDGVLDRRERPRRARALRDLDLRRLQCPAFLWPSLLLSQLHRAHHVLADHVALEIDLVALAQALAASCALHVNGITCTSNCRSPRPATVRLTPSTATDPCG